MYSVYSMEMGIIHLIKYQPYFKPELKVMNTETDNLKLHFQSIFLWAIFYFNMTLNRDNLPSETNSHHVHVRCIEPLKET
jgi:hypothetical protein